VVRWPGSLSTRLSLLVSLFMSQGLRASPNQDVPRTFPPRPSSSSFPLCPSLHHMVTLASSRRLYVVSTLFLGSRKGRAGAGEEGGRARAADLLPSARFLNRDGKRAKGPLERATLLWSSSITWACMGTSSKFDGPTRYRRRNSERTRPDRTAASRSLLACFYSFPLVGAR